MAFDLNAHAREPMRFPHGETITVVPALAGDEGVDEWGDFHPATPYTIDGCQIQYAPGGDDDGNRETSRLAVSVRIPSDAPRVPTSKDRIVLPGSTEQIDIDGEPKRPTHGMTGWQPHIAVMLRRTRIGGDGNLGV